MDGPALMPLPGFALLNPGYVFYVFAALIVTNRPPPPVTSDDDRKRRGFLLMASANLGCICIARTVAFAHLSARAGRGRSRESAAGEGALPLV
jgi:hypothetical protein